MDKQQAYQTVRHYLRQWQQALAQVDEVHAKFGAAETPGPDRRTLQPGQPIGGKGVEEIRKAENRALRKWEDLQEAVERWSAMVLRNRPPLQEVLKILRANMPALEAEYGVTSLAVIGPYAKGDDYEASRLDIMVEYHRPLGYGFIGMENDLSDLLGVKVHLVTRSVIEERYPQSVLDESAPV
jgi:predicted nucleotidyltransferase